MWGPAQVTNINEQQQKNVKKLTYPLILLSYHISENQGGTKASQTKWKENLTPGHHANTPDDMDLF